MQTRVSSVFFQETVELKTKIQEGLEGSILKATRGLKAKKRLFRSCSSFKETILYRQSILHQLVLNPVNI